MPISTPCKINNHLSFLGNMEACIYLLEGSRESILINGGVSYVAPEVMRQIRSFNIDQSKITKMLLLHSHFDHVGIAPFFKRRHPNVELIASQRAWDVLKKPKVIESINAGNQYVTQSRWGSDACSDYDLEWTPDIAGSSVGEGDLINLGGVELIIYETPGHSPCSISAYVPELNALFPSDALGLPCDDTIATYGTSNYTDFEKSIQKLKWLPVKYICFDHYGYVTGAEAQYFIENSIQAARDRRFLVQKIYNKTGDVDKTAKELAYLLRAENRLKLVPDETFIEAHRQITLHLIKDQT